MRSFSAGDHLGGDERCEQGADDALALTPEERMDLAAELLLGAHS